MLLADLVKCLPEDHPERENMQKCLDTVCGLPPDGLTLWKVAEIVNKVNHAIRMADDLPKVPGVGAVSPDRMHRWLR